MNGADLFLNTVKKSYLFYKLSLKVVPIGFYTFFSAFWQLFPLTKSFLVGCIPIPEHMRSLHCYPQTALPPSHF